MKYLICFCLLLVSLTTRSQNWDLKYCIETALKNNPQVRQMEFNAQNAKVNWEQTRANQLPFVNADISHGLSQGRSIDPFSNSYVNQNLNFANYSINTNLVLWNGSNLKNSTRRDQLAYEAGKLDIQQVKDNITINVILAYLQVLNNEELYNLAAQQKEVTSQQLDRLDIMNRQGAILPSVFYDMKGQLANDELNLINNRTAAENARLNLAQLMNVEYTANVQLQKISDDSVLVQYPELVANIIQSAAGRLAIIKAADTRVKAAAKELQAARGSRMPTVYLGGGAGTNYSSGASTLLFQGVDEVENGDYVLVGGNRTPVITSKNNYSNSKISYVDQWKNNFNSSIVLGIRIPILNGAQARSRIKYAQISQERSGFELKTVKTQLQQSIQQAYINMNAAFERYSQLLLQVDSYQESFRSAEVRFKAGVGTSVDYLLAKNNLDRARGNLIAAKYDYQLRTKVLDFYRGEKLY